MSDRNDVKEAILSPDLRASTSVRDKNSLLCLQQREELGLDRKDEE